MKSLSLAPPEPQDGPSVRRRVWKVTRTGGFYTKYPKVECKGFALYCYDADDALLIAYSLAAVESWEPVA